MYLKPNIVNDTLKLVIFMIVDLANIIHQYSQSPMVTALLESINQCL